MPTASSSSDKPLRVGPTQFQSAGYIRFHRYRSREIAIEVVSKAGEPCYVATVSLVPYGAPYPGAFGVWLKGWSENEGVPEALVRAGIVQLTGLHHRTGYARADHARLTERARALLATQARLH